MICHSFSYSGHDGAPQTALRDGHYRNPILAGAWPDPSICRVGRDYYLVNSTFAWFPGIEVLHSQDLVNWRSLGHAIDRPTQLNYAGLGLSRGLFAPALSHHKGTFYLACTMVDAGGNFIITASHPAGPWSDPVWLGFDGIDPALFFDDDGRAWMLNNGAPDRPALYPGHRAIWMQQFEIVAQRLVGPRKVLLDGGVDISKKPVWIEGPHLYKRQGWYYLCAAEGGTSVNHSQVILRSRTLSGPFEPWAHNPILTQRGLDASAPGAVSCTGHADWVIAPDGHWWAVFLGCRALPGGHWLTGRETFLLPMRWTDDGWPVILPAGDRVPLQVPSPAAAQVDTALALPLNGPMDWRDDFSTSSLSPAWFTLRAAAQPCWQLGAGALALSARADRLSGTGWPALLARRVQHARFEATLRLAVPPQAGVEAGLTLLQSERQHDFFGLRRGAAGLEFFVERCDGGQVQTLATLRMATDAATVEMRISADESSVSYSCAAASGVWHSVTSGLDIRPLSVQAAGGGLHFTGAVIGLHARLHVSTGAWPAARA